MLAAQLKAAIVTDSQFPHDRLLGGQVPTQPPLPRNSTTESGRAEGMGKTWIPSCLRPKRKGAALATQAFLFAGGTSVNRWQSLSLSCRTQSRNAEMQFGS